jgi:hypothetical protein
LQAVRDSTLEPKLRVGGQRALNEVSSARWRAIEYGRAAMKVVRDRPGAATEVYRRSGGGWAEAAANVTLECIFRNYCAYEDRSQRPALGARGVDADTRCRSRQRPTVGACSV